MLNKNVIPICAYTPPPNGTMTVNGEFIDLKTNFHTDERYREYRECGFDEILIAGEDKYVGEPFRGCKLERLMDMAMRNDLKVIVYDERIVSLTVKAKERLIGELFNTEKELDDYVANCMKDYTRHPAFYGVSIIDEPKYTKVGVIGEINAAVKKFSPNAFVMTCFLPCIQDLGLSEGAFGKGFPTFWDSYADYAEKMGKAIGYFHYDCYPFGMWEEKNDVCSGFIRNMQVAVGAASAAGVPFHMTVQSFSSGAADELRRLDESDLNWQTNLALGFGVEKIYYFTYWRFTTRNDPNFTSAIMDDDGSRIIYDEVQRNNALIQKTARFTKGYRYVASQVLAAPHGNKSTDNIIQRDIGLIEAYSADSPLLLNELSDGDKKIYMLLNLRDPYEKFINEVGLKFKDGRDICKIVKRGELLEINCSGGIMKLSLEPGEAVFII